MEGNLIMDLIHQAITALIQEQLKAIVTQVNEIQQPYRDAEGENGNRWTCEKDENEVRRQLPLDFVLSKCISPLLIIQQWHHGLSQPDGSRISALKTIPPKDIQKSSSESFAG